MTNNQMPPVHDSSFDNEGENFDFSTNNLEVPVAPPRPQKFSDFTKAQKFLMAGFGLAFILIVVGFFWRLDRLLEIPVPGADQLQNMVTTVEPELGETDNSSEAMKKRDTDNDGMLDYDEYFIYNTSPYLEDTDGDGLRDREEIVAGTDPTCYEGRDCTLGSISTVDTGTTTEPTVTIMPTATELRQFLVESGQFTEEELAVVTDEDLLNYYAEVAAEETTDGASPATETVSQNPDDYTVAEIRQFLIEGGIEEETVNSLDDATLREVFQEAWVTAGGDAVTQ